MEEAKDSGVEDPRLGDAKVMSESLLDEAEVATWVKQQLADEVQRLREQKTRVIPVPVKNFAIVREDGVIVNRIECGTKFDFTKIRRMLLSVEIPCWKKPGFSYLSVVLFSEKPIPLMVPYLYDKEGQPENELKEWVFINSDGKRARHRLGDLSEISS